MKIYAVTQKGIGKSENEDRIVVNKSILAGGSYYNEIKYGIVAVADGVGGNNAGAVASHFVSNKLTDMETISNEQLLAVNKELLDLSNTSINNKGMATTLAGINVQDARTVLFSVGNTRVYLLQNRKYLKQITVDDTTLNYLLSTGQLSPEEAENFDKKNEITACFGGGTADLCKPKVSVIENISVPFMITSDGIHDHLSSDQIEDIIEDLGISEVACKEIIATAVKNGSCDDLSIILGDI